MSVRIVSDVSIRFLDNVKFIAERARIGAMVTPASSASAPMDMGALAEGLAYGLLYARKVLLEGKSATGDPMGDYRVLVEKASALYIERETGKRSVDVTGVLLERPEGSE